MKNILYLLFLFPVVNFSQAVVGQCVVTDGQIPEYRNRLTSGSGLFTSTNYNGEGFYGDGNEAYRACEQFLNEEEGAGFVNRWDWFYTGAVVEGAGAGSYEPTAENQHTGGSSSFNLEGIHFAGLFAKVWDEDATEITFSGQTKSRNLHALDLARAAFAVMVDQASESDLDFSNTTRFPVNTAEIGNPLFIYVAKMAKYVNTYSLIAPIISGDAYYIANYATVETWLKNANDYAYAKIREVNRRVFGEEMPDDINSTTSNTAYNTATSNYSYYNSGGTPVGLRNTDAQQSGTQNRNFDFVELISAYGIAFNDTNSKELAWQMYKLWFKLAISPDGTILEWYRENTSYPAIDLYHVTLLAFSHAVAVQNGVPGVTDKGKFFDYTTSVGSTELYTSYGGGSGGNTSGGTKGLLMALKNFSNYFRTTANGGWSDVRYKKLGGVMEDGSKSYTTAAALANTYYNDTDLYDFYMLLTSEGYGGHRYYGDGGSPTFQNAGPYNEASMGLPWGVPAQHAGFAGIAQLEDYVFTAPTCSDGIQNGDETGVDCGGSCPVCTVAPKKATLGGGFKLGGQQKIYISN